jgi:hypothetical protein
MNMQPHEFSPFHVADQWYDQTNFWADPRILASYAASFSKEVRQRSYEREREREREREKNVGFGMFSGFIQQRNNDIF